MKHPSRNRDDACMSSSTMSTPHSENNGKAKPVYGASEFRIWRVYDVAMERWKPIGGREQKKAGAQKGVDSRVHRFGRDVGFHTRENEIIVGDSRLMGAQDRLRQMPYKKDSDPWRVECQGNFECFVLKAHPNSNYAKFLTLLDDWTEPVMIESPSNVVIASYIMHMADEGLSMGIEGRGNSYNSIRGRIGAISGTLLEFGNLKGFEKDANTKKFMADLEGNNDPHRAKVFDFEE
jgi:hypothetical protein